MTVSPVTAVNGSSSGQPGVPHTPLLQTEIYMYSRVRHINAHVLVLSWSSAGHSAAEKRYIGRRCACKHRNAHCDSQLRINCGSESCGRRVE